jgi:AcrR family transcriptional regulator
MEPDERRAAILEKSRELFGRHPFAAVSVADLATAAGVSAPLVVFYFGSKQKLYLEIVREAATAIGAGLEEVPGPPSLQRLELAAEFYAAYAHRNQAAFLTLLRGSQDEGQPEARMIADELRDTVLARILADLGAAGVGIDPEAPETALAVRSYLGYVDTAVTHWLALPAENQGAITSARIAQFAVGAFTGSLKVLMDR